MPDGQLPPAFRFAPSPNGYLHLGHAYSALLNEKLAREADGKLLLRIEDVDRHRSKPEFETAIYEDLEWMGITFDGPPRRQSEHLPLYQKALDVLLARGLAYVSTISRRDIGILAAKDANWPRDPDGALLPPASERYLDHTASGGAIRLNLDAALAACQNTVSWREDGAVFPFEANKWGDVVLKSRDQSFAYHLAVVVDDAEQKVTHIVRGQDLHAATAIHRVLQKLLALPEPDYLHHALILDETGGKLSKSRHSPSIRSLREAGLTAAGLRRNLGF